MNENIKVINEDEFNTRFPKLNDTIFDNLDEDAKELYFQLYSTYSCLFRKYITKKLNLEKYDEMLQNSKLNYLNVSDDEMDIYQDFTKYYLKYFYIRNNLYIERLTREEKEYLFQYFLMDNVELNDQTIAFIEKTYPKVIFEKTGREANLEKINFGPEREHYYGLNNSIVIGVRYDEFNLNGLADNEWDTLHEQQVLNLNNVLNEFEKNEKTNISVPLTTIIYSDYSIKKKPPIINKKSKQ